MKYYVQLSGLFFLCAFFAAFFFAVFACFLVEFFLFFFILFAGRLVAKINEAIRAQSEFRIKAWRTRISNAIVRLRAPTHIGIVFEHQSQS